MGPMKTAITYWWTYFWKMAVQNPKSTFSGLFSTVGLLSAGALTMVPPTWKKGTAIVLVISAISKLFTLAISMDPNKQLADVPGVAEPQVVAAHEMPDNPANIPVIEKKE